jgi:hypothetical protein
VFDDLAGLIVRHTVPGSVEVWRWRQYGKWGRWWDYVVEAGALEDGRWYVRRLDHDIGGPWRAELYATREDAYTVALAVQAAVEPELTAAGYRLL